MEARYFSKVVYWIFFLSLVIVAIFFVHDVCQNYQERATSIQVTTKITKLFESPTITLCFNPGFKVSVLQEYKINPNHFKLSYFGNQLLCTAILWASNSARK